MASNRAATGAGLAVLSVLLVALRLRKRAWAAALAVLLAAAWAFPAGASIQYLTDEDMVQLSDSIVTGTVASVNSSWVQRGRFRGIVTDVELTVQDSAKGRLNKSASIFLHMPGGRVGSVVTRASEMPEFQVGDEVLLYLQYKESVGYVVVAGKRGKYEIVTDGGSGVKYIAASSPEAQASLAESAQAVSKAAPKDGAGARADAAGDAGNLRVRCDDYLTYLRGIARAQEKQ